MFLSLLLFAVVCLSVWAAAKWAAVRRYWEKRGVPHQPPSPLFGSLSFLVKQDSDSWLRESKLLYRYPYIGIWLFWRPALLVNCPEIARRVLVSDNENFRDRLANSGASDPYGSQNLFIVKDPVWSSVRRRLTPVFTSAKLKAVEALVVIKCSQLMQRIQNSIKIKNNEDLKTIYSDLTTDLISKSAFGLDGNATLTGDSCMKELAVNEMTYGWHRTLSWFTIFFWPELTNLVRSSFFTKSNIPEYRKIFHAGVVQSGGYGQEKKHATNFFDALIKIKQETRKEGEEVSEDFLIAQAAVFFTGGLDTSAITLTYATYEMAFAPEIQDRLYQEVLEAKQNAENGQLGTDDLRNLPYLNGVIKETLRKWPILVWLDRIAAKDYQISKDLKVAAGTPVYINLASIHRNPDYYPDPEKFDPERFLAENAEKLKPFTHMPFGEGPRHCIGMRFAMQTMQNTLATVVLNYKIKPAPNSAKPNDCPVINKGLFCFPRNKMYVEFVPRN